MQLFELVFTITSLRKLKGYIHYQLQQNRLYYCSVQQIQMFIAKYLLVINDSNEKERHGDSDITFEETLNLQETAVRMTEKKWKR